MERRRDPRRAPYPARLAWLYLLALVPVVTDLIEKGGWPSAPREWVTEIVAGTVIALLVRRIRAEHLRVLSLTRIDGLTGLGNRRAFEEAIEDECSRARRNRSPLSLAYVDIDNFKIVNDRDGHHRGDCVLQQFAQATRGEVREHIDRGFRLGGDEFALLLPGSTAVQAQALLARVRQHCVRLDPLWAGVDLSFSAGVVQFATTETAQDFVQRADVAMYGVKRTRRACDRSQ